MQDLTPQRKREIKRLLRKIVTLIDNQGFHPRGHVFLDKVVLAHLSKSLNVAQCVMVMIDAGFPEEAFGVSRTIVEIALNLRYITNRNSEQRAKRFVHYVARWKMELMRRSLKHFYVTDEKGNWILDAKGERIPQYSKADFQKMLKGKYAMHAKVARKYPKRTSWTDTGSKATRGGVWMMAMEPDRYDSVNGMLNNTQGISRSQHQEESSLLRREVEEESSLLRRKIEELNKNTVLLIAEAGKLIRASEQLSFRLQSFEDRRDEAEHSTSL